MPNRIRILPDEIANRIAAGEVVDRPASVVKELVENAVDAGADRIVVEVAAGGKESVRVSDNGCGMSRDDALLALERHATSKISDLSDLFALHTFGFRGEALPSIAAVSRLTLETKQDEDAEGTRIEVVGGRVRNVASMGRSRGTTVTLHGLFFNVPARRKFLKGIDTEYRHIVQTVTAMVLAYPDIAFVLKHNGRETLRLERATRERRMEHIFGVRLGEDAVLVDEKADGISVWGFVGSPDTARKAGVQQVLIANRRWVLHKAISYAVSDGYGGLLPKGFSPAYCLFLEVDPARIDVNVHPSKREVRFADERTVYRAVAETVRRTLRRVDLIPDMDAAPIMPVSGSGGEARVQIQEAIAEMPARPYRPTPLGMDADVQMALPLTVRAQKPVSELPSGEQAALDDEDFAEVSLWQLHNRYILAHIKNGLIAIDQQVAHQRILYERALEQVLVRPATSQRLLFPMTLDFGIKEIQVVRDAIALLEKMGFGIRDFGGNTVVVDAIPIGLKMWNDGQLLRDVIRDVVERETRTSASPRQQHRQISPMEHLLAASFAWHTCIRAGETLSHKEMQALIDQLFATKEPFVCPYGRPTLVKVSLDEIGQWFGR